MAGSNKNVITEAVLASDTAKNFKMAVVFRRFSRSKPGIRIFDLAKQSRVDSVRHTTNEAPKDNEEAKFATEIDGFEVLRLYPKRRNAEKTVTRSVTPPNPPRTTKMTPEQDWTDVWPGPKTFHPASVPLPVRQGCNKYGSPPDKYGNTELMKIPNFLHLTPPAIKKHCEAIKKFCTKWPEELETDKDIEKHFPVEIVTSDYCHSSCSIRDPKARIVSLKVKVSNLEFDKHSKDKFLRIVGPRYNPETDYVTITTDSCPLKKQNYDYVHYLLTAVYFESWKYEDWEKEKGEDDMEEYIFSSRQSYRNLKALFDYNNREMPGIEEFGKAVENWLNNGDDRTAIQKYKENLLKLLSLPSLETPS